MSITKGQKIRASDFRGLIMMWAASTIPTGWLELNGQAVSRTTYADLFTLIGTTFGAGDGSTTFNVPDFRSSVPVGVGQKTRVMTFNAASAVDPATNQITVTSNKWMYTGQPVVLAGSSLPTGLSAGTYYVIRVSDTEIKLAASVNDANNGNAVDITADGSGSATLTQALTDRALAEEGGTETQTTTPRHTHTTNAEYEIGGSGSGGTNGGVDTAVTINPTGEDAPNGMPPFVAVKFIMKT